MSKLVVNPGTPNAWEIQLRPGVNRLGRSDVSDFQIADPSVSSSHCDIVVNGDSIVIKDLGSTNGTFVNHAQVQEATLQDGSGIRLGGVVLTFYSEGPASVTVAEAPPRLKPSVRIASSSRPPPVPTATALAEAPPMPEAPPLIAPPMPGGRRVCKFHPKSPARYLCNKCNRSFCEFCVTSRVVAGATKKVCRTCGIDLVPLHVELVRPTQRGFFASLPGAFIYPFRGFGVLILLFAAAAFGAIDYLKAIGLLWGPYGWVIRIGAYGFLFLFLQNIVYTTTSDESEPVSFPDMDGLFGAAFTLAATVLTSFSLAIGLAIARLCGVEIPVEAIIGSVIIGCLYFPMAFLAAAMKDTALAANPLIVIPAILKVPFQYLIAAIVLMSVFGVRQVGNMISGVAGGVTMSTRHGSTFLLAVAVMGGCALAGIYLLTVSVRILGLLYNANKEKLGWF